MKLSPHEREYFLVVRPLFLLYSGLTCLSRLDT